ncbi:MAG: sulfite exporter TauE/SafE family protein [Anaerolineae bacterium]|nr:sulfite exporter TauE/SafE family protein [Anaerolineae bacterium]
METVVIAAVVGFLAQMVDGALGMAYGVTCTTFLLAMGVPPAAASASVHTAEVFTTAVSGVSHWRLGNVDRALFWRLLAPGVLGGVIGAYILVSVPTDVIRPVVAVYLAAMGLLILVKALRRYQPRPNLGAGVVPLGLLGGLCDAIGGGGWGPIVTSTLVARGGSPRKTIGSVNSSEFFVTLAQSVTFLLAIGLTGWQVTLGLLLGGVVAAPLAALACSRVPARALMAAVGVVILVLSLRTIGTTPVVAALLAGT